MALTEFRGESGRRFLMQLFFENGISDKSQVRYTLKDFDHEGYPSLYKAYIEMEDVTEWEFANTFFEGWAHWQELCQCTWFKPYIARWREELNLKLKARSLKQMKEIAANQSSKNSFSANKFLIEGGWETKTNKAGRPTKEKIKEEAERLFQDAKLDPHEQQILSTLRN